MGIELVAELGQTIRGDVAVAIEAVEAFARAGATAIKFQLLDPERIATADAVSYWQTGPPVGQRESFGRSGMIAYDKWAPVKEACDRVGVKFGATPFDLEAVDALDKLEPDFIKIASGDITWEDLCVAVARTDRDMMLSTGAATVAEIDNAVHWMEWATGGAELTVLACSLAYPTPIQDAGLARIQQLWDLFGLNVGYSDHTVETGTGYAAVLAGAEVLEKHCSLSKGSEVVPDDAMALSPVEFVAYANGAKAAVDMLGDGRLEPMESEMAARVGARRAARWARDLPPGWQVMKGDFTYLRPDPSGDGESLQLADDALDRGRRTARAVTAGRVVMADDF